MFSHLSSLVMFVFIALAVAKPLPDPSPEIELIQRASFATVYSGCTAVSAIVLINTCSMLNLIIGEYGKH